jgi:hypothetical protein
VFPSQLPIGLLIKRSLCQLGNWEFPVDNDFASLVAREIGLEKLVPRDVGPVRLCEHCLALDFWASGFSFEDEMERIRSQKPTCGFCKLLINTLTRFDVDKAHKVRLNRENSTLRIVGGPAQPALTINRSPGKHPDVVDSVEHR